MIRGLFRFEVETDSVKSESVTRKTKTGEPDERPDSPLPLPTSPERHYDPF